MSTLFIRNNKDYSAIKTLEKTLKEKGLDINPLRIPEPDRNSSSCVLTGSEAQIFDFVTLIELKGQLRTAHSIILVFHDNFDSKWINYITDTFSSRAICSYQPKVCILVANKSKAASSFNPPVGTKKFENNPQGIAKLTNFIGLPTKKPLKSDNKSNSLDQLKVKAIKEPFAKSQHNKIPEIPRTLHEACIWYLRYAKDGLPRRSQKDIANEIDVAYGTFRNKLAIIRKNLTLSDKI